MKRFILVVFSAVLILANAPKTYAAADDITGHYFEAAIRTLVKQNIMGGYGDGVYKPNKDVTRAEFAALMVKTLELGTSGSETSAKFTDVASSAWYYGAIVTAVDAGIVGGYPDNTFKPNNKISRQEMAAMIMRAINSKGIISQPAKLTFKDAGKINPIFKDSVQRLVYLEVMAGNSDNSFGPKTSTTRGQVAAVLLRMIKIINNVPVIAYSNYEITLNEMLQKQMNTNPQTDKNRNDKAFVSGDYIDNFRDENGKTYGDIVNSTFLNVREEGNADSRKIGTLYSVLEQPTKVQILGEITNSKNELWYEIVYGPWRTAKQEDVAYYLNPDNFSKADSKEYFQFLSLSKSAGITADELNNKILKGKGTLEGQGQAFIEAGKIYGINEIYLVSHAMLETGEGYSNLAKGIEVSEIVKRDAKKMPMLDENGEILKESVDKKTVYNFFGIGAFDQCPDECGSERAYQEGWFTPGQAIIGGAKYISEGYINHPTYKQDTLYKMRWNPGTPGIHQYASDIGWAAKQVTRISQMYELLDSYTLFYDVPVYKK